MHFQNFVCFACDAPCILHLVGDGRGQFAGLHYGDDENWHGSEGDRDARSQCFRGMGSNGWMLMRCTTVYETLKY